MILKLSDPSLTISNSLFSSKEPKERLSEKLASTITVLPNFSTSMLSAPSLLKNSILCPHSMSGLETILWAQEYPDEVEAVVGLDMVLPRTYDDFDFDSIYRFEKLAALARDLGLIRFYYSDGSLPSELSKEEKKLYRAIACKIAVNVDIINEGQAITDAVREIDSKPKPDVPMIMFVSDGTEVKGTDWIEKHYEYASDLTNAKVIELGCGHYVHNFKQDQISLEMKEFINALWGAES